MLKKSHAVNALLLCVLSFNALMQADDSVRKVKVRTTPQYPELARKMNVSGSVRLEVRVAANGQVRSVRALGGHPLLIDAAASAVRQWRYEPGPEATEIVEIRFNALGN